ncbi:MAG: hypothetical protein GQ569_03620 [Methylococcaceae bacterium]|nr:hypothetical protein [Methylococcaceae bacterium]
MAKKRKPKYKKNTSQKPLIELEQEAERFFENNHYKEAIAAYKNLLKIEKRENWQQQLAQTYLLRAQAIAEKELYQEAAVLWENYAQQSNEQQHAEQYLTWLSYAKQYSKIADFLKKNNDKLDKALLQHLYSLLGAVLLAGEEKIITLLTDENPVIAHYPFAKAALQAYCQNNTQALENNLKQIPFRSPYKDFRTILKALVSLESDRDATMQSLDKIPNSSPYYSFSHLCQLQELSDTEKLANYAKLDKSQQIFIQKLSGLDNTQINLLKNCQRVLTQYSDKQALEIVMKNSKLFGEHKSQQFGQAILAYYPAGKRLLQSKGSLSEFDRERLKALAFEKEEKGAEAVPHWLECIEILKRRDLPEEALKTALIMRHTAEYIGSYDIDSIIDLLRDSLTLDPVDKDSYVKLVSLLKHENHDKDAALWLTKALEKFPDDVDILTMNIIETMRKNAFKKAAGFAKQLLKIDPINPQAKGALVSCHAGHARKLIKQYRYDLAEKELAQAETIDMGKYRNGLVQILQGLSAFKAGDKKSCKSLVEQGISREKGDLCGHFRLNIEILNLDLPASTVLRLCPKLNKSYRADVNEIIELVRVMGIYSQWNNPFVEKAFSKVKAIFKQSFTQAQQKFSVDELQSLCESLDELKQFEMLRFISKAAQELHVDNTLFDYYQIYSKANGEASKVANIDMYRLKTALNKAKQVGDNRSCNKISQLLEEYERVHYSPTSWFDNYNEDEDEDEDDFFPFFGNDYGNPDTDINIEKLMTIVEEVSQMGDEDMFGFLFDGKMPTPQQVLNLQRGGEKTFNALLMKKILEKAGIDKDDLADLDIESLIFGNR